MIYINIPYVPENNRIDKDLAQKELEALDISEDAKYAAFEAIYNRLPRGVSFEGDDLREASLLEKALSRLGIPYRLSEESEYVL
jgi:hypothetical protein